MIRVVAIGVSHWHALYDAAYLRHLMAMPDVELVAIQDSDAGLVARRAAEVGSPATFTDYRKMLATTRPNFKWRLDGTAKWPRSPTTCSIRVIPS
jgi:predicted dehydrogenase